MQEQPNIPEKWWVRPVHCIVATLCCVVLMLVTANDPSADDAARGASTGLVAWLLGSFIGRK